MNLLNFTAYFCILCILYTLYLMLILIFSLMFLERCTIQNDKKVVNPTFAFLFLNSQFKNTTLLTGECSEPKQRRSVTDLLSLMI